MSVLAKWHVIPSNDFSRVHEYDRHTDGHTELQTERSCYTVTSVAIVIIHCLKKRPTLFL